MAVEKAKKDCLFLVTVIIAVGLDICHFLYDIILSPMKKQGKAPIEGKGRPQGRPGLSIAISHNMDNVNEIEQADLNKYFGLTAGTGANDPGKDASGSKTMTVDQTNHQITYEYQRGGVTLTGVINYATQTTTWTVAGTTEANRIAAFEEGLKLKAGTL